MFRRREDLIEVFLISVSLVLFIVGCAIMYSMIQHGQSCSVATVLGSLG